MGRPGHGTCLAWNHRKDRRWNETHELTARVGIEWSQNKSFASCADSFIRNTFILAIGNVWQYWSHCDECGSIDAFEIRNGQHPLTRGWRVRLHSRSRIPATERNQRT